MALSLLDSAACRLRRGALDRALAEGADPCASRALATRAHELTRPNSRHAVAVELEHLVDEANAPPPGFSCRVPLRRRAILEERVAILTLAAELETAPLVAPRGVALARELLRDGASALYVSSTESLHEALRTAHEALEPV